MKNALKEFGKDYFKKLLSEKHENIKFGDELKIGIMFLDENGKTTSKVVETINKDEL